MTVLGKDFTPNLTVMFGGNATLKYDLWGTRLFISYWSGQQTMVCLLPPSIQPGAVPVSFKGIPNRQQDQVMFNYKDGRCSFYSIHS